MFRYLILFAFIALTLTLLYVSFILNDLQNVKTRYPHLFCAGVYLQDS